MVSASEQTRFTAATGDSAFDLGQPDGLVELRGFVLGFFDDPADAALPLPIAEVLGPLFLIRGEVTPAAAAFTVPVARAQGH